MLLNPYRFGSVGSGPNWDDVISLLHFDGVTGSATYTDEKGKAWNKIGTGTAELSSTKAKFGSTSLRLTGGGTTAGIREVVSSDIFSYTKFTIELFFNLDSVSGADQAILSNNSATANFDWQIVATTSGLSARAGTGGNYLIPAGGSVVAGTWHHAALVRNGTTFSLYLDGALIGSINFVNGTSSGGFISLGHGSSGGIKAFGYFDELRLAKAAIYTASFVPPVAQLPNS